MDRQHDMPDQPASKQLPAVKYCCLLYVLLLACAVLVLPLDVNAQPIFDAEKPSQNTQLSEPNDPLPSLTETADGLAPTAGIAIQKEQSLLGVGQRVRPGVWTPLRLTLDNPLTRPITVRIELLVPDADQDIVHYHRTVTLTPQRSDQQTWLYAVAPSGTDTASQWRVQVIDQSTQKLLDYQDITIGQRYMESRMTTVGIIGQSLMGLEPYSSDATHQEKTLFLRGLTPANLPDRWYGLSMLSTIIWTPQVDPASTQIPPDFARALRQWIQRGGHLVIVLPAVGNNWPASPLADLVPQADERIENDVLPLFLGSITSSTSEPQRISMRIFEPQAGSGVEPVLVHGDKTWGIAQQQGRGRVSLIGVDLTDSRLARMGLPSAGSWTMWSDLFGWQGPALLPSYVNSEMDLGKMNRPDQRQAVHAGDFIAPRIAMRDTAAPSLLLAIALFVVYWVVAGPVQFVVFKQMKIVHHAWVGFVAVVLLFTAVSWGGAYLLRPSHTQIRHVALLTATRGQPQSHVHAWLSLYVPTHGPVETRIGDDHADDNTNNKTASSTYTHNAIWSTGFASETQDQAFPDTRTYNVNAASPDDVSFAYRSTAKQLELDYLGELSQVILNPNAATTSSSPDQNEDTGTDVELQDQDALPSSWDMPQGELKLVNGWPVGSLVHNLPGELRHVSVIYCDGSRLNNGRLREPVYWLYRDPWLPGATLHFTGKPANTQSLVAGNAPRWTGRLADLTRRFKSDTRAERTELLTFFNMLPPPDYTDVSYSVEIRSFMREVGRDFDLTALARMKCLIVIGHLGSAPLPVPLTVDGDDVPSNGDTIVRWIFPLDTMPTSPATSAPVDPTAADPAGLQTENHPRPEL